MTNIRVIIRTQKTTKWKAKLQNFVFELYKLHNFSSLFKLRIS